jgi:flagellar motor switch/type III secretory pathway protein FliN
MAGYIYFKLSFERNNYIVSIGLTEGVGNVLSRREEDSKIGEDILIWVVLVAADAEIDAGRLKEVKAGDMMVFKNAYIKIYDDGRPGGIVMVKTFDGNVIGKYDIENQRLMNGDSHGEKDNRGVPEGIIDGVPITLSIELQRIKTSIKELKNIIKGQLIEIHKKIPDEVIISANGKIIGTGRLLKVNDCLCVEVLTIDG